MSERHQLINMYAVFFFRSAAQVKAIKLEKQLQLTSIPLSTFTSSSTKEY